MYISYFNQFFNDLVKTFFACSMMRNFGHRLCLGAARRDGDAATGAHNAEAGRVLLARLVRLARAAGRARDGREPLAVHGGHDRLPRRPVQVLRRLPARTHTN